MKIYDDAVVKMGKHIALQTWHNYMGGSLSPLSHIIHPFFGNVRSGDASGIVTALSILYNVNKKRVQRDIDRIVEECKAGKIKFK